MFARSGSRSAPPLRGTTARHRREPGTVAAGTALPPPLRTTATSTSAATQDRTTQPWQLQLASTEGPSGDSICDDNDAEVTSDDVICRIERLVETLVRDLDDGLLPVLSSASATLDCATTQDNRNDDNNNIHNNIHNNDENDENDERPSSQRNTPWNGDGDGDASNEDDDASSVAAAEPAVAPPTAVVLQKRFTLQQCRSYASLLAVASFCHSLLRCNRTTTLREVYYHFVTHFRCQRECNAAIVQLATLLHVPRHALGLQASPRGSFVGDVQLIDKNTGQVVLDGRSAMSSVSSQGYPISPDWLLSPTQIPWQVRTIQARCILIVESEGVFHRLCEDQLVARQSCIVVTSRGFPDFATRAMVSHLHTHLQLPVCGLADCNPFGASVLHTFVQKSTTATTGTTGTATGNAVPSSSSGVGGGGGVSHVHWLGLRPSQVQELHKLLPPAVFQKPTTRDNTRLDSLLTGSWVHGGLPPNTITNSKKRRRLCGRQQQQQKQQQQRWRDTEDLRLHKVELEALNWLGLDALTNFVERALEEFFAEEEKEENDDNGSDSDAGSDNSDDSNHDEGEDNASDYSGGDNDEDDQGPQSQPAEVSLVGVRVDRTILIGNGSKAEDDNNTTTSTTTSDVETEGQASASDDGWLDVM